MEPRLALRAASEIPPLPPLERLALLLDLDGTLLDIAPAPDDVVVPEALPGLLARLSRRLKGALAIVSGRTVEAVTKLLPGANFAIAGEHGAAILRPGLVEERAAAPAMPAEWRRRLERIAAAQEGVLLEEKPHGFVLHYRRAPDAGAALGEAARALVARHEDNFVVQPARMAWEIRPHGADKGTAVASLLNRAPFIGRVPVFIGDDTTDLDGIRAARAAGGFGFEVGPTFGNARGVRAWLAHLADAPPRTEQAAWRAS